MGRFTPNESYRSFIDDVRADGRTSYDGANLPRLIDGERRSHPTNELDQSQIIPFT